MRKREVVGISAGEKCACVHGCACEIDGEC